MFTQTYPKKKEDYLKNRIKVEKKDKGSLKSH